MSPRVWLLNLDAERELARAGSYETPKRLRRANKAREAKKIQEALCAGEAVLPEEALTQGAPAVAVLWCPTPNALRAARRAHLRVPPAPPTRCSGHVNHRRFALEVAASPALARICENLPPELGASSLLEAERRFVTVDSPEADDLSWLEVPPAIGRGSPPQARVRLRGKGTAPRPSEAAGRRPEVAPREALDAGGFLVEPEVTLTGELSLHGLSTRQASS